MQLVLFLLVETLRVYFMEQPIIQVDGRTIPFLDTDHEKRKYSQIFGVSQTHQQRGLRYFFSAHSERIKSGK